MTFREIKRPFAAIPAKIVGGVIRKGVSQMLSRKSARLVLQCLASITLPVLSGCGTPFSQRETLTLATDAATEKFVLNNRVGDVTINTDPQAKGVSACVTKTGKGSSVHEARKALEDIRVTLARNENTPGVVEASVEHPNGSPFRQYAVSWRITMPASRNIVVKNCVGDVHVEGVSGAANIHTDVGDAIVNGPTDKSDQIGPVDLTTGVGDIRAANIGNGIHATTSVGDITASGGGKVQLQSDVGDVTLHLSNQNPDSVNCTADVGDVEVFLSPQRKGALIAETDVGDTIIELGAIPMQNVRHRRKHFRGELGGSAEPTASLQTDVGSVTVRNSSEAAEAIN
jgi:hypothetical protein